MSVVRMGDACECGPVRRNTIDETERTDVAACEELELGDVPLVMAQWEVVLVVVDQNGRRAVCGERRGIDDDCPSRDGGAANCSREREGQEQGRHHCTPTRFR